MIKEQYEATKNMELLLKSWHTDRFVYNRENVVSMYVLPEKALSVSWDMGHIKQGKPISQCYLNSHISHLTKSSIHYPIYHMKSAGNPGKKKIS